MKKEKQKNPISIRAICAFVISAVVVILGVLLLLALKAQKDFKDLKQQTEDLLFCEEAAPQMIRGSDYLTSQVRNFAVTGDLPYCENYFEEVHETRRRDSAIEAVAPYAENLEAKEYLDTAMDYSVKLMDLEYYSMALVFAAKGYPEEQMPDEVRAVTLPREDNFLSPEEQQKKAVDLVLDEKYQSYKDQIVENVELCTNKLIQTIEGNLEASQTHLSAIMVVFYIMVCIMLVLVAALVVVFMLQVTRPVVKSADAILDQKHIPLQGVAEVQYLEESYNEMFDRSHQKNRDLRRTAFQDALTGLYNRAAYEKMIEDMQEESFGLLLIDVNKFKGVNDTCGHDVGDQILKKTADILRRQFRSNDLIFRFGGDEFAVIMNNAGANMMSQIQSKVDAMNVQLGEDEKLPPVSLSVGAAFGRGTVTDALFRKADQALYEAKGIEGGGVSFART